MKKPYLNQWERYLTRTNTFSGARLLLHIAIKKIERAIGGVFGKLL